MKTKFTDEYLSEEDLDMVKYIQERIDNAFPFNDMLTDLINQTNCKDIKNLLESEIKRRKQWFDEQINRFCSLFSKNDWLFQIYCLESNVIDLDEFDKHSDQETYCMSLEEVMKPNDLNVKYSIQKEKLFGEILKLSKDDVLNIQLMIECFWFNYYNDSNSVDMFAIRLTNEEISISNK